MKKFAILAAVVALVGCAKNGEDLDKITNTPEKSQTEFYASMPECDTRTHVEDNKYLRWNAGDEITVFAGNSYNSHWQFAGEDGANSGKFNEIEEGGFVTGTPLDLTANYAIYPYDENITITEAGVVSLTLPAEQEYNHTYANSFGAGANAMMAVTKNTSDNFLAFKNLCGYLKLKFYGDDVTVKSITVKGNNGEKIAGPATVTMAYGGEPTIAMGNDATDTITIDCGEGVVLSNDAANPTIFWVVIPEIIFEGGITIEVTDINDQVFSKQTTNEVPIENNLIQPMASLDVVTEPLPPLSPASNEIWYTTIDGNIVEPHVTKPFNVAIISNTYENGKGVITLEGNITSVNSGAFTGCTTLQSMILPNGVTTIGYGVFDDCTGMQELTIPSSITNFDTCYEPVFYNCTGKLILNCNLPNSYYDTEDDEYPILYGADFTEIVVGDEVTSLGNNAFRSCTKLTTLTLGKNVTSFGYNVLYNCNNLTSIKGVHASADGQCWIVNGSLKLIISKGLTEFNVPDGVVSIGDRVFYNNDALTNVILPEGLSLIGQMAFYSCENIQSITIPSSVNTINDNAFYYCSNLAEVYCKAITPPTMAATSFRNNADDRKIYVPAESLEAYESASGWKAYENDLIGYDFENGEIAGKLPQKPITYEWYTTATDGVYEIDTPEELVALSKLTNGDAEALAAVELDTAPTFEGETINITDNIDLEAYCSKLAGSWTPIINFGGTFDGNGHTISNLYIQTTGSAGLFVNARSATFKNLTIRGKISCSRAGHVGAVASKATSCMFENCISDVDITTVTDNMSTCVGGICGFSSSSKYIACQSYGDISDTIDEWEWENYVGGIVGNTNGGDYFIACSKPQGNVEETNWQSYTPVGGVLGCCHEYSDVHLQSCYTSIYVKGRTPGHITNKGYYDNYNPSAKISNCYYSGSGTASTGGQAVKGIGRRNYGGSSHSYDYGTARVDDVDAAVSAMNNNIDSWNSANPEIVCNYKYINENGNIVLVKAE